MSLRISAAGLKARERFTSEEENEKEEQKPKREKRNPDTKEEKISLKTYGKTSKTAEKKSEKPVKTKVNEGASCSKQETHSQDENSQRIKTIEEDMSFLKQSMGDILPIIKDLKRDKEDDEEEDLRSLSGWPKNRFIFESEEENEEEEEIEEGEITEESISHLQRMAKKEGKTGPKISKFIATEVTNMLTEGISKQNKELLYEKYNPPSNLERINVVQVNTEIYKSASKPVKINESRLTKVQECMMKAMTAIIYVYEKNMNMLQSNKRKNEKQEQMAEENADAIALLANASHMLDVYRKSNFKRGFKEEMSSICQDEPISDKLFGTDTTLTEKVKNISDINKLTNKINKKAFRKRRYPFLGKRESSKNQRYQSFQQNYKSSQFNYPKRSFKQWKYKKNQKKIEKK